MRTRNPALRLALIALAASLLAGCGPRTPDGLVASAKEYLAKNDRNGAVIQLKNALSKNPDMPEARYLLGRALLETGDVASAEKELQRAAELKYPYDQVAPQLARATLLRGNAKKVIDEFGKAEVNSPQAKADLQTTLGQANLLLANVDAARNAFAAAQAAVPGYPPALIGDARIKALQGDIQGASVLVDAAIAKAPNLIDGWQFKGDLLAAQSRGDEAIAAYRKALEIRPAFLPARARIVQVYLLDGKNTEAGKELEAMRKIAPKHPQTFYLQALLAYRDKKYPAAREAIQQQLRAWPDNLQGLVLSASIDIQLGAYAQAEAALQKVLQRVPQHRYARMALVQTYLSTGQPARALDTLRPLLDGGSEDSDLQALAGEVFIRNGDTAQAGTYFAKAAALDPRNANKRRALAMSRLASGDADEGLHELQDVAATDPGIRADLTLIAVTTNTGKYDMALEAVAALEKKQPGKALPHNLRATILAAKGDVAGARKSFETALAIDPADFTAASGLARLDLLAKKPEDAKKRFEAVIAKDPKSSQAMLALAELSAQTGGKLDDVAALINRAVTADPTSSAPRLALISYYMNVRQPAKAVAAAQDALAAMPDRADLLYAAGQAQQAAGEPNQAAKSFNKLAAVRPGSAVPYLKEAEAQLANKDYDAALQGFQKALALKPDLIDAQRGLISVYLAKGKFDDALGVARNVQKQRPSEAIGYLFEGDLYAFRKQWAEAASVYRKGLAKAPSTELAAKTLGALRLGGMTADADRFSAAWLRDHPKDRDFRTYLAETALLKGDWTTAVREYNVLLEMKPDDALTLNNLAYASGKLKDPKAIEYARKADQLVPNNAAILDTLGALQVETGDVKKGVDTLQRAVALAPNAAGVRLNLARALLKDGQKDAAKKELEALAKLGDKFAGQAEVAKLMKEL